MFKCLLDPSCHMEFTRVEHLARHERKHTHEKPFRCHCSKSFSRLDNWRQHKASVHKDATEENAIAEIRLVQVHKSMQRGHNIRKAATIVEAQRQKNQLDLTSISEPPAVPLPSPSSSAGERSAELVRTPLSIIDKSAVISDTPFPPLSYGDSNHEDTRSSTSSYLPGVASSTFAFTPSPTECSGPGIAYNFPYSLSGYSPTGPSSSYGSYPTTPYFVSGAIAPFAVGREINCALSHPSHSERPVVYRSFLANKGSYSSILMEPFTGDAHLSPTNFHLPGTLQPTRQTPRSYAPSVPFSSFGLNSGARFQFSEGRSQYSEVPAGHVASTPRQGFSASNETTSSLLLPAFREMAKPLDIASPTAENQEAYPNPPPEPLEQEGGEDAPGYVTNLPKILTSPRPVTHESRVNGILGGSHFIFPSITDGESTRLSGMGSLMDRVLSLGSLEKQVSEVDDEKAYQFTRLERDVEEIPFSSCTSPRKRRKTSGQ